ncbi:MAG: Rab family GTPase [Candidatus Hodarchaeota archaeon]
MSAPRISGVVYILATNQEANGKAAASIATPAVTPQTPIYKVIIAGEGGVGKTSIIERYIHGFSTTPIMTVGSEFSYQELEINSQKVGLSIWDFGGEDRFRELMPIFCLGAHGAFLVFDLYRFSTFLQLAFWVEVIRDSAGNVPIVLVGSKCDLNVGPTEMDIHDFCQRHEIVAYFPVSARTGENVHGLFAYLAEKMLKSTEEGRLTPAYSIREDKS